MSWIRSRADLPGGHATRDASMPWASRMEVAELIELARRKRIELGIANPRKPTKDPVAQCQMVVFPCRQGGMPPFRWDGAIDNWRKTMLPFSNERIYIMQRDDPMHTLIPRLDDYEEDVEIMVVAQPLRGAEGMGAATVGPGHRNTTYTGVRGAEAPKGKGRRRERDRLRGQEFAQYTQRPMHQVLTLKIGILQV